MGTRGYKAIYMRDFNLNDPNIDIYLLSDKGEAEFQGCDFDPSKKPVCGWHMYGMAPRESLLQNVMDVPYRLFPPPIGKP